MEIEQQKINELEGAILTARKIALIIHKNPDGDAVGSLLAFTQVLEKIGKVVAPVCADPVPENFKFLPGCSKILPDFTVTEFDLVIILDCGDLKQTGFAQTKPEISDGSRCLVKIDHHAAGGEFGNLKLVYPDRAATSEILFEIFEFLKVPLTLPIATCLLTGLCTDTGSFRHTNTTSKNLRIAAKLLSLGANLNVLARSVFQTTPLPALKLWGQVLSNLKYTKEGVIFGIAKQKDFQASGTKSNDLAGINDLVNSVPEAKFSVLLSEREHIVKASLRTLHKDCDVSEIATKFGGGGHVQAASFSLPGKLEQEISWRIVDPATQQKVDLNAELLSKSSSCLNRAKALS